MDVILIVIVDWALDEERELTQVNKPRVKQRDLAIRDGILHRLRYIWHHIRSEALLHHGLCTASILFVQFWIEILWHYLVAKTNVTDLAFNGHRVLARRGGVWCQFVISIGLGGHIAVIDNHDEVAPSAE